MKNIKMWLLNQCQLVDNSELPLRLLCCEYGAQAAYTPLLHPRIFSENQKYRTEEFTTCNEDRPLFVQFCADDPDILVEAARRVEPYCDYIDINFGCPQRIARRGYYGAFLMDNLPLVRSLVEKLSKNLNVLVSCKFEYFQICKIPLTVPKRWRMLLVLFWLYMEEQEMKMMEINFGLTGRYAIRAVQNAVRIPVLANGNILHVDDAWRCIEETGLEGVLSAEFFLENPALFGGYQTAEWVVGYMRMNKNTHDGKLDQGDLLVEYLKFCKEYPVPWHVHKMLGDWFRLNPNVRNDLDSQYKLTSKFLYDIVNQLRELGGQMPLKLSGNGSSE